MIVSNNIFPLKAALLTSTIAGAAISVTPAAFAQGSVDCTAPYKTLSDDCVQLNNDVAVAMPSGENTEYAADNIPDESGFIISIDGNPINKDARTDDVIRHVDKKLEEADVRVQFDGLGAKRVLDLAYNVNRGDLFNDFQVKFSSRLNYPAFVERGEVRFYSKPINHPKYLVTSLDIAPNGQVDTSVAGGETLYVAHRVYDQNGRYDETRPIPLQLADARGLTARQEIGTDQTAFRYIPQRGGVVTVSGGSLPPSSVVNIMGEAVTTDPSGRFVFQRILPDGDHWVDVDLPGTSQSLRRRVNIPSQDRFIFGLADITVGLRDNNASGSSFYDRTRLAFYKKTKYSNGLVLTASVDTGEGDAKNIFTRVVEKDPRSFLSRIDPRDLYPSYGDDSTSFDDTPTDGRVYLRADYYNSYVLWGNYKSHIGNNAFVRNERQLYGLRAHWEPNQDGPEDTPDVEVDLYASRPGTLAGRDILRGTGGSTYFLKNQDVLFDSETLTIVVRDGTNNRVIGRRQLVKGEDYTINYVQGTVLLTEPLSGSTVDGIIQTTPGNAPDTNLVVQYEYVPPLTDVEGTSFGGRVSLALNERIDVGVTGMSETTGTSDQRMIGADAEVRFGEKSVARLDLAMTDGPGFGSSNSTDGGLIVNTNSVPVGSGTGLRAEIEAHAQDIGIDTDAIVGGYFERRTQGLSTQDYDVTSATGDEDLAGVFFEVEPNARTKAKLSFDSYKNGVGDVRDEIEAELSLLATDRTTLSFAASSVSEQNATNSGDRIDLAARADLALSEDTDIYAYGQGTVQNSGLEDNNRIGAGINHRLSENWELAGEISGGSFGLGAKALATHSNNTGGSTYFGLELDPTREVDNLNGTSQSKGKYVFGTSQQINDRLSAFAENSLDLFGNRNSLTSAYGVTYKATDYSSYDAQVELGRVDDATNGDFDRTGFSLGSRHQKENWAQRNRLEYRIDEGVLTGAGQRSESFLLSSTGKYERSESERLTYDLGVAYTDTDQSSVLDGELIDFQLGYAVRPIDNDRLNLLFKYRYLHDMYGQQIDGSNADRVRQKSHILSADVSYDLNEDWTVGAKLGARLGETATSAAGSFVQSDAVLGVVNARYNLTHDWDVLVEARALKSSQNNATELGAVAVVNKHINNNVKFGIGYNFGSFTSDLSDMSRNNQGIFMNLTIKF